jgi:predicted Fe-S protein YdhL (DUF1289 family)
MANMQQEVMSPCIGVCAIDDLSGLCQGCYRTLEEIRTWWEMPASEQKAVIEASEARQAQMLDFD